MCNIMTRLLQFFAHADARTKCKSGETVAECAKRFNVDVDQVYVHGKKLESGGSALQPYVPVCFGLFVQLM